MLEARFCYETVTPDSAEEGETEDHGFYLPGGWRHSIASLTDHAEVVRVSEECTLRGWTLRDVLDFAHSLGIAAHKDAHWFYSYPEVEDYSLGEEVAYSLHISGVTASTYGRITRLLTRRDYV